MPSKWMTPSVQRAALVLGSVLVGAAAGPIWLRAGELSVPNTFSNGAVVDATAVNANFAAVETAVDDNASRLDELESVVTVSNSRVGIGTSSPNAKLEVYGGLLVTSDTGGNAATLILPWAAGGTFTGDIVINVAATTWKSVTYKIHVAGTSASAFFAGGFYSNNSITGHTLSVNGANAAIGAPSVILVGEQSFRITVPINTTITHPTVQLELGMGGSNVLPAQDVTISIN